MNMSPIEFIFLGLLGGAALAGVGTAVFFVIRLLIGMKKSVDELNQTIAIVGDKMTAAQFIGAVKLIAQTVPGLVTGTNGLAQVMGIFNKVMLQRDVAAGNAPAPGPEESGFIPYDEEAASRSEAAAEAKRMGFDTDSTRMDALLEKQMEDDKRAYFAGSGQTPPSMTDLADAPKRTPAPFIPTVAAEVIITNEGAGEEPIFPRVAEGLERTPDNRTP